MPRYLVYGANSHTDFRKEELESLALLNGLQVNLGSHDQSSPFFTVELNDDEEARRLVSRSVLTKGIYELLADGRDHGALHEDLKGHPRYPFPQYMHSSFKFVVEAFDTTRSNQQQRELIDAFAHLGWQGRIDMKDPQDTFAILEDWRGESVAKNDGVLLHVYFARFVAGTSRQLVGRFDLKKRGYLGTTSMESELSLVSANQVLAGPGRLIYDPFVGTGSFLVSSSAYGATTVGSDIDGRQIKGKGRANISSNFEQYDLSHLLLDCLTFDVKHPPWHTNFRVDGILADPPYGVRAGAKTLGRSPGTRHFGRREAGVMPDGRKVHERENYIPPKRPYELSDLADDLLDYAAGLLVDHGRLVFWLPTVNEDYSPVDLPQRSDLRLLANSTQNFGRWSRRLLTYTKVPLDQVEGPPRRLDRLRQPGHVDFRYKYYSRFGNGKEIDEQAFSRLGPKEQEYARLRPPTG
ncbi:protein of unknown function [Taphrina deformans PYCC 5710]|uniref:tRNA (guanine(10)-N(2))-methyltransferase n=1 Tax=Taphrina deformans (strain PYCC 5710 / ATCC 11124 / CBS 356.35 / IMI 108563 / JCM 9778 / NBRC 8474) TaxID=1097556 RepID=R4XEJ8_TAPDE|nr:protein of unknown function [Taphrina deformans PYCC 5710]|eukprot:CCG84082.1 protein of unknown function [Taphrina deformans PYCC 5710]